MRTNLPIYRLFASNFVWAFLGEAAGKSSVLFANIYYAKILLPTSYGVFSTAFSVTIYIALFLELGSSVYGTRQVARGTSVQLSEIVNPIMAVRFGMGVILFIVINVSATILNISFEYKKIFMLFSFYFLAMSLTTEWIYRGLQSYTYIAFGNILIFFIVISSFLFISDPDHVSRAAFSMVVAYSLNSIVLLYVLKSKLIPLLKISCSTSQAVLVFRSSLKIFLSGIFGMGYLLVPSIALVMLYGSYEAGIFNAFFRPMMSLCGLLYFIPIVVFPMMSKYHGSDEKSFGTIREILVWSVAITATIASLMLVIFGKYMVVSLLGLVYAHDMNVFNTLILVIPLFAVKSCMIVPLVSSGNFSSQANAAFVAFTVSLLAGIPLILQFSILGAAISVVLSELFSCAVIYHAYRLLKADDWQIAQQK